MKKFLLDIYIWFFWKHFHCGLKRVLGHKSLATSIKEMKTIEMKIRVENDLDDEEKITWENSTLTKREIFAKYITLRYFNEIGEILAFFRSVDKNKILEVA